MSRSFGFGAAAVLAVGALAVGCSDDGDTIIQAGSGSSTVPTRADSISTSLEDSWADNESSINGPNVEDFDGMRVFRGRDGTGFAVWTQGDDGEEQLYVSRFASGGAMQEPHLVFADVQQGGYGAESVESFVVVETPRGDAVMAFVATQDSDPSSSTDVTSERVYVMTWTSAAGFSTATAVDTNSSPSSTDDNNVETLFVATNLVDGTQSYDETSDPDNDLDQFTTGSAGDSAQSLTPFIFIGWQNQDSNGDVRAEGRFVDVDTLVRSSIVNLTASGFTGLSTGESLQSTVLASGRDLLFSYVDTSGTPADQHLILVRLDPVAEDVDHTVDLRRGTNTNTAWSVSSVDALVGDGFRPINGQGATWIVLRDVNYEDATVTQTDADLVIFQVSEDGNTVEVDEFDHNAAGAANGNGIQSVDVQGNRGASVLFLYYRQVFDVTGGMATNDALFARAVRLNEDEALADNVSDEVAVNGTNDGNNNGDADVLSVHYFDRNPFCGVDTNPLATYVVFRQDVDEDNTGTSGNSLRARTLEIDDITASPIDLVAGTEQVIVQNDDPGWSDSLNGDFDVVVLDSNDPDGAGIVYFVLQGNNVTDSGAANSFTELRPVVFASSLPTSATTSDDLDNVQIGTETTTGAPIPFPDWTQVADDSNADIQGLLTSVRAAKRDFVSYGVNQQSVMTFDADALAPQYAFLFFPEIRSGDDEEGGVYWSARVIDLAVRTFTSAEARFSPDLSLPPARLNDGSEQNTDVNETEFYALPEGNTVVTIFNLTRGTDDTTEGRFFVNVIDSSAKVSDAALLTNDTSLEIDDHGEGPTTDGTEYMVVPGPTCDNAVGAWFFYMRYDYPVNNSSLESYQLQGRRITGTNLPRR